MNTNIKLINAINLDTRLKAPHKALLHALVSFRNSNTGQCNPSVESISERAGLSKRNAFRILSDLKEVSIISYSGKPNVSTQYELYPFPNKFRDSAILSPEPYKKKGTNFTHWSDDLLKLIAEVKNSTHKKHDYKLHPMKGDLNVSEWNRKLFT
ncbi:helix-turn-helix domain-containing protein [Desulfovibrio gilichinskyi]|uniref:helix-turn-helix domain-containing protein n=1 Tax=Desulfovibrio gilichinskyi TaxID=1519643 RepID=UPI001483C7C3